MNKHEFVWQRTGWPLDERVSDRNVLYRLLCHDELMNYEVLYVKSSYTVLPFYVVLGETVALMCDVIEFFDHIWFH